MAYFKALYHPFSGVRSLSNEFRFKSESDVGKRSNVTFAFRHTVRQPCLDESSGDEHGVQNTGSVLGPTTNDIVTSMTATEADGTTTTDTIKMRTPTRVVATGFKMKQTQGVAYWDHLQLVQLG